MKTVLTIVLSLFMLSITFAQQDGVEPVLISAGSASEHPILSICEKFQEARFTFQGAQFQGTQYENLTEVPPEMIDYINEQIQAKPEAVTILSALSGVTFSGEILYNKSVCFNGSVLFNNSQLQFLKLYGDPLKGINDQHIYLHVEMIRLEQIISELRTLAEGDQVDPLRMVGIFFKVGWTLIQMFFSGDLSIQPIGGIFKIIESAKIVVNLPDLSGMGQAIQDRVMQQLNTPEMQNCVNNLVGTGLTQEQAIQQCLMQQ